MENTLSGYNSLELTHSSTSSLVMLHDLWLSGTPRVSRLFLFLWISTDLTQVQHITAHSLIMATVVCADRSTALIPNDGYEAELGMFSA